MRWMAKRPEICAPILVGVLLVAGCGTTLRPVDSTRVAAIDAQKPRDQAETFLAEWNAFLAANVDANGRLDYAALHANADAIDRLYAQVAALSPDSHPEAFATESERLAWWINAYNAATIYAVVQAYPIGSVLEVKPPSVFSWVDERGGFFVGQRLVFGGEARSLYFVEKEILGERFDDARYHFALNCASLGCPVLPPEAFNPAELDAQLDRETRAFLRREDAFRIDHATQTIWLSSLFDWYAKEYVRWMELEEGQPEAEVLDFVALHLEADTAQDLATVRGQYRVRFIDYDWSLNDR